MARKTKKKNNTNTKVLTYIAWILGFIALVLSSLVAGYYFGYEDAKDDLAQNNKKAKQERLALLKKLEAVSEKKKEAKSVNNRLKEVLKNQTKTYASGKHEFDDPTLVEPPKIIKRVVVKSPHRPKLAIIIDDMSVKSQVKAVKSLHLPITMSFFPPSYRHPNSAKLASMQNIYMVHLPMEAKNFNKEEVATLRVKDSQQVISKRIKEIKRLFPKVQYINNHTGSKFTSNEIAMNRLIFALQSQNISFIDSRTTADTKVPLVMSNYGLKYLCRDIFLDHEMDKEYVKKQIKKAVKYAKNHGSAIAIGHPHPNTLLALKESKNILKEVELVYVNGLY